MSTLYFGSIGNAQGDGSRANPWDVATAIAAFTNGNTYLCIDTVSSGTRAQLSQVMTIPSDVIVGSAGGYLDRACYQLSIIVAANQFTKTAGRTNVYETTSAFREPGNNNSCSVIRDNSRALTHVTGTYSADAVATVDSTPGSFWTGPTSAGDATVITLIHPIDSTDPRSDGKEYDRSQLFGTTQSDTNAIVIQSGGILQDSNCYGVMWRTPAGSSTTGVNGYMVMNGGGSIVRRCFFETGDKHVVGNINGATDDITIIEDVQAEQCSPYAAGAGSATTFVAYDDNAARTGRIVIFRRCRTNKNLGLIGSAVGTTNMSQPAIFSHNAGSGTQFKSMLVDACYFPGQSVTPDAPVTNPMVIRRTRFGSCGTLNAGRKCFIDMCYMDVSTPQNNGGTYYITRTVIANTIPANANGTFVFDHCSLDLAPFGAPFTSISRNGTISVTVKNSIIKAQSLLVNNLAAATDTFVSTNNHWIGAAHPNNLCVHTASGYSVNGYCTLAQMVTNGFDTGSTTAASFTWESDYRLPTPTTQRSIEGVDIGAFPYGDAPSPAVNGVLTGRRYGSGNADEGIVDVDAIETAATLVGSTKGRGSLHLHL
jgi:hypothetical protein